MNPTPASVTDNTKDAIAPLRAQLRNLADEAFLCGYRAALEDTEAQLRSATVDTDRGPAVLVHEIQRVLRAGL